ncbi:UDP-N-acetylmuramoyl-tripeptide--D-alanyl-D-alanine ligase [Geoalkalibacter ferrihydriticus]|uniref:UDP-N-acetylmuramoyl-tripeptide--D-alanyl-D-alanine ligase n=2 Tax=Geoalkalibacter ferrihydriticus TaxID=392333 RepID=A0A0C2HT06_9BACT|nr:UDP-N-acetylmuramoyl-tripeptide--D-alanyl-D-alanine ligase [Geoalkalibacter ferrihydriticus]KIH77945.1 UDP-N-acetylmuramoylalanyl-D-glutamyl-2, 6-diaminopimelate--D-alanyl-D-alanine ligase [Geoalkalibacter ferrihydriticus DSM 17813]SDM35880.1 UDP-N-acetylmuramoyl-tripeptide--D-alanyl-D-alanine ligase [Geoalkalibacter ferrihydriticus]
MKFDLATIARITGGTLSPAGARGEAEGVSTDSRSIDPGTLFVPLRGDRFDGHDFLVQAARRGAAACLSEEIVAGFPIPVVHVGDTLRALGDLAAAWRQGFEGPLVAVTGSSGKTTTKEMLACILEQTGVGLKTEGNFNNLIGVPLTLFKLEPQHRWAVIEMGMSARGEIARLSEIARPRIGVITNIGPAHLETLQGVEGVARAKGELFASLPAGGTAIVNADDPRTRELPVANGVKRLLFGECERAQVRARDIRIHGHEAVFKLCLGEQEILVRLRVPGRHNVHNALAAAAAASSLGVDPATIARGLGRYRPIAGRLNLANLPGGALLIDDSYNANPLSVKAALATLDEMPGGGRRIAVLGDMLELGQEAARLHREIGAEAARRCDLLIALGRMAQEIAEGARAAGMAEGRVWVARDHQEIATRLRNVLTRGDRLLVKGSRGMKMEKICTLLQERQDFRLAVVI